MSNQALFPAYHTVTDRAFPVTIELGYLKIHNSRPSSSTMILILLELHVTRTAWW